MNFVFVSNYINHHQIPFCEAMLQETGGRFVFLQTQEMDSERRKMGWKEETPPYVKKLWENREEAARLIRDADVLLAGWAPEAEDLVTKRLLAGGKITFRISERIYKDGQWKALSPRGLLAKHRQYTRFAKEPYYLLSAGAYVASDFSIIHAFPGKMLRWGYFPPLRTYREGELEKIKNNAEQDGRTEIVFAGRFVGFKHPEMVPELASSLKEQGERFHITVAGGGEGEAAFREEIQKRLLEPYVTVLGLTSPNTVRSVMERSRILLFPSDHGEGWGAVVNEAMNSGCAVVAGNEAGAVPFLIRDGENGIICESGHPEQFLSALTELLHDRERTADLGKRAGETIADTWNAGEAAGRLVKLCGGIAEGQGLALAAKDDGPVSIDPALRPFLKIKVKGA